MTVASQPVVHALAARLRPGADGELIEAAAVAARTLAAAPGVLATRTARSNTHLLTAVWLPDPNALEPFAASPPHMAFVMRGLAPVIEGMWSVSVACHRPPPQGNASFLCAFALPEAGGIFEWQVRRQLDAIDALPGFAWAGPTVEERERYRAGGVVLLDQSDQTAFAEALAEATDESMHLEVVIAPLLPGEASR